MGKTTVVPALARRWTRDKDSDVDCARNEPFLAHDRKDLDMRKPITRVALIGAGLSLVALGAAPLAAGGATAAASAHNRSTASPIKHLVVIFQENVSFDHYFGTYPNATNTSGQPFTPAPHTKQVNGSRRSCSQRTRTGPTRDGSTRQTSTTC